MAAMWTAIVLSYVLLVVVVAAYAVAAIFGHGRHHRPAH